MPAAGDVATWRRARVKDVFKILNGATPQGDRPEYWGSDIPWVTPDDLGRIGGKGTLWTTARGLSHAGYASCAVQAAPPGSLVISTRAPIGHVAILAVEACANQGCRILVPREKVSPEYFLYLLMALRLQLQSSGSGTTFQELGRAELGAFYLRVPPLAAQIEIAAWIDATRARLDSLVRKNESLASALQERFEAKTETEIRPAERIIQPLKRVAGGVTVGVVVNPSTYIDPAGSVPFFRGIDIRRFEIAMEQAQRISTKSNETLVKSQLHAGDVVSVRDGDPGLSSVVPPEAEGANCASLIITRRSTRIESRYLCHVFNSGYGRFQFRRLSYGAAQHHVNVSGAVLFPVPLPDIDEQRQIAAVLDEEWVKLVAMQAAIQSQTAALREYSDGVVAAAVTGQLDIHEAA